MRRVLIGPPREATRDELQEERERQTAERRAQAEEWAREYGWSKLDGVEPYGRRGLILHRPSGALYEPESVDESWTGDLRRIAAWYVGEGGWPRFLKRPDKGPLTLADAQAQAAELRRQQEEREQAAARRLAAQPRRLVTVGYLEEWPREMTLAEAVGRLEQAQATIREQDGELIVEIPQKPPERERLRQACRLVFAARDVVLAELARKSDTPLADRLPDEPVRAGGGVG